MQSKKTVKKSAGGDVFGTFLRTVRGADVESDPDADTSPEVELALLRLLKISGPQTLEKLRAMIGSDSSNFINTCYKLAEDGRIEIGPDPNVPGETLVRITQQGVDSLTKSK